MVTISGIEPLARRKTIRMYGRSACLSTRPPGGLVERHGCRFAFGLGLRALLDKAERGIDVAGTGVAVADVQVEAGVVRVGEDPLDQGCEERLAEAGAGVHHRDAAEIFAAVAV